MINAKDISLDLQREIQNPFASQFYVCLIR